MEKDVRNFAVDDTELILSVLNAAPNGAVDTSILRFDVGVLTPGATGIAFTTTAANGTIITFTRPGRWIALVSMDQIASVTVDLGVSINGSTLTADPVNGVAGVIFAGSAQTVAANLMHRTMAVPIRVTGIVAAQPGGAPIRIHASDGGGNAGGAGISAAAATVRIMRLTGLAASP